MAMDDLALLPATGRVAGLAMPRRAREVPRRPGRDMAGWRRSCVWWSEAQVSQRESRGSSCGRRWLPMPPGGAQGYSRREKRKKQRRLRRRWRKVARPEVFGASRGGGRVSTAMIPPDLPSQRETGSVASEICPSDALRPPIPATPPPALEWPGGGRRRRRRLGRGRGHHHQHSRLGFAAAPVSQGSQQSGRSPAQRSARGEGRGAAQALVQHRTGRGQRGSSSPCRLGELDDRAGVPIS